MRKLKAREVGLVLVPLGFALGAALLQFRPHFGREFSIESAQAVTPTPLEVAQGYDTKWEVVLNSWWPRPAWWNKQTSWMTSREPGDRLTTRDGKKLNALQPIVVSEPRYDKARDRYVASYLLELRYLPRNSSDVVLKSHLAVGMMDSAGTGTKPVSPVVAFSQVVRRANTIVQTPPVSHLTNLVPYKAFLILRTPAETRANGGLDTALEIVFKKTNEVSFPNGMNWFDYNPYNVTDEKGRPLLNAASANDGLADLFWSPIKEVRITRVDKFYATRLQWKFPTRPRQLSVKGFASLKSVWPVGFLCTFSLPKLPKGATLSRRVEVPIRATIFRLAP